MVKKNQRKKSVVDASVPWTLASRVILHFIVFLLVGVVVGLINQFLSDPFGGFAKNLNAYWRQTSPMLLTLICLIPIFVRDTLTLSNRIAGPICNMRDKMKRLGEGEADVPELRFRKGDMWSDVLGLFNTMVARLNHSDANQIVPYTSDTTASQPVKAENVSA
jgi:hypothetical protein